MINHKFATFPSALVVHLKRFEHGKKITSGCSFKSRLVIPGRLSAGGQVETYKLQSIIVHEGSINRGHYVTYSLINSVWTLLNDSQVSKVSFSDAELF